jgi:hypothetical protein
LRIGIVVDGDAESQALKLLTQRISIPDTQLLDPIYANMQPRSTPGQIARSAKSKIDVLTARGVDKIVVLIDKEDRLECPSQFASNIEAAFSAIGCPHVEVAVKNRNFENWLIADVDVFNRLRSRYRVTKAFQKAVSPNKADSVPDAESLLNKIVVSGEYHKRRDAAQITKLQEADKMARNSRSFRRFLRIVGHSDYLLQSKKP